jgi:hypothetical protein
MKSDIAQQDRVEQPGKWKNRADQLDDTYSLAMMSGQLKSINMQHHYPAMKNKIPFRKQEKDLQLACAEITVMPYQFSNLQPHMPMRVSKNQSYCKISETIVLSIFPLLNHTPSMTTLFIQAGAIKCFEFSFPEIISKCELNSITY